MRGFVVFPVFHQNTLKQEWIGWMRRNSQAQLHLPKTKYNKLTQVEYPADGVIRFRFGVQAFWFDFRKKMETLK